MVAIPFPSSSAPGYRQQESGGRLVNLFAEPLGEGRQDVKRVRVPGLTQFASSGQAGFRGMIEISGILYVAWANQLYRCTSAGGVMSLVDTLGGTGSVYFARNNALTPDQMVVTESGAFTFTTGAVTAYTPLGLPIPNSVFMLDGYFFFTTLNGEVYATGLNDTTLDPQSVTRTVAKPDQLVRGVPLDGKALFFGTQSLEVWSDVGAQPFPLQRAVVLPVGLIGPDAVAGWEDGWGSGLLFVANDGTVRAMSGYTPSKVSPPDLDRLIQRDPNPAKLMASVHMVDGHPMWTITGNSYSWVYDLSVGRWHERESYLTNRWRGMQTINAFGKWLVGDRGRAPTFVGGNVYQIDPANFTEAGDPIVCRLESAPVEKFPQRVRVGRADFHIEVGMGIATGIVPTQTKPVASISWSDDGGVNWSTPLLRELGQQATYKNISIFRVGMSTRHGRRWRIEIADPVYLAIFGGDQAAELRAAG